MRNTQPLFRFDTGWLYIMAGLVLCMAGVLLPAQRDLFMLNQQLHDLRAQEQHLNQRLRAHASFLIALDEDNPVMTRRLVEAQLNLAPAGDTPVLLAAGRTGAVSDWIEATVAQPERIAATWPDSMLAALATGPYRLWLMGGAVLCVFIGLLTSPAVHHRAGKQRSTDERHSADETAAPALAEPDELSSDDAVIVEDEVEQVLISPREQEAGDGRGEDAPEIITQPKLPFPTNTHRHAPFPATLYDD